MSEITKEYLDQKFAELPSKKEFIELKQEVGGLKQEFGGLKGEFNQFKDDIIASIDDLARMTANGFEEIRSQLDVRKEVENLDKRMRTIEQALNIHQ